MAHKITGISGRKIMYIVSCRMFEHPIYEYLIRGILYK